MMGVAVIALAVALAGAMAAIVSLAFGRVKDAKTSAKAYTDERVDHANTRTELERRKFELEVTQKALVAANTRAAALEEVIADDVESAPNPDLKRADVRSRVLRIARRWAEAAAARSPLPAVGAEAVPVPAPADATDATGVLPDGDALMQP